MIMNMARYEQETIICRKAERKTNYEYCNKTDHAGA